MEPRIAHLGAPVAADLAEVQWEIACLERMNPAQVQATAPFEDLNVVAL